MNTNLTGEIERFFLLQTLAALNPTAYPIYVLAVKFVRFEAIAPNGTNWLVSIPVHTKCKYKKVFKSTFKFLCF